MGQGAIQPLPERIDIQHAHAIPLSIIFVIQICIVFFFGKIMSKGWTNLIASNVSAIFVAYLWTFFIYYMILEGSNPSGVFGQVFMIFLTVFIFTMIFCTWLVPDAVKIFENTIGYWIIAYFTSDEDKEDLYKILKPEKQTINDTLSSDTTDKINNFDYIYKLNDHKKQLVYDYNLNLLNYNDTTIVEPKQHFDETIKPINTILNNNIIRAIINTQQNIGILCWTTIAMVVAIVLSMEYMSLYPKNPINISSNMFIIPVIIFIIGMWFNQFIRQEYSGVIISIIVFVLTYGAFSWFSYLQFQSSFIQDNGDFLGIVLGFFIAIFVFTMAFINILPSSIDIFANTVGYWVAIMHFANNEIETNNDDSKTNITIIKEQIVAIKPILPRIPFVKPTTIEDVFYLLNDTNVITNIIKKLNDSKSIDEITTKNTINQLRNTKYNIGVLCWTAIASVISTFLSMEYMAAYI